MNKNIIRIVPFMGEKQMVYVVREMYGNIWNQKMQYPNNGQRENSGERCRRDKIQGTYIYDETSKQNGIQKTYNIPIKHGMLQYRWRIKNKNK